MHRIYNSRFSAVLRLFLPVAGLAFIGAGLLGGCRAVPPQDPPVHVSASQPSPRPESPRSEQSAFVQTATAVPAPVIKASAPSPSPADSLVRDSSFLGWATNGPAVFARFQAATAASATDEFGRAFLPPMPPATPEQATQRFSFAHYLPGSLNHLIWTNFIAHTNGRTTRIWAARSHPAGWPAKPPVVQWDTNGLMWGMRGLTGLSPCWEGEVNPGQVPITALTRRHGYTRGHSMGPDGFGRRFAGKKVWFLTTANQIVEVKILREAVRTRKQGVLTDYSLLLFDRDLPPSIQPLLVADYAAVFKKLGMPKLPFSSTIPRPLLMTEQGGGVNASIAPFIVMVGKGGDSGSPSLLPLPGQLVFLGGATTSGPSPEMQADMDALCAQERLQAQKYQMTWADLSAYPID